jgi:DNA primase
MTNYRELRQKIKDAADRQKVGAILSYIGVEVDRSYKFKIRDERTPSASISPQGWIKDFGDGWSGDIVAFLHETRGVPLREAADYVAECWGIR